MGVPGRLDIVACVGELKHKGIEVLFPKTPRRVPEEGNLSKRGIVLVRVTKGECVLRCYTQGVFVAFFGTSSVVCRVPPPL